MPFAVEPYRDGMVLSASFMAVRVSKALIWPDTSSSRGPSAVHALASRVPPGAIHWPFLALAGLEETGDAVRLGVPRRLRTLLRDLLRCVEGLAPGGERAGAGWLSGRGGGAVLVAPGAPSPGPRDPRPSEAEATPPRALQTVYKDQGSCRLRVKAVRCWDREVCLRSS